ncbi:hypothetical protein [Paenibacillus odorifer]|uniref:hypothetical protein n=1 Tax=Paenibacillus odorifer TaxID=189426 RepID=UPI0015C3DF71|nr:hypothetical protein [Paenibacillus odorifer]
MAKSLYGYYMGYMCYWLNDGFIRQWVGSVPNSRRDSAMSKKLPQHGRLARIVAVYMGYKCYWLIDEFIR